VLFLGGSIVGAIATGSFLWATSGLVQPVPLQGRLLLLLGIAVLTLLRDFSVVHVHLPESRRQVPQSVFARGPELAAVQFGFEMGTGARTYLTATSPYLLASFLLLLAPSFPLTLAAAIGFGVARGILPMTRWLRADVKAWDDMNDRWAPRIAGLSAVLACGAVLSLASTFA
jgi:hypothetical protein